MQNVPVLVVNGYGLSLRHKGVGSLTARFIAGLEAMYPGCDYVVVLPQSLAVRADDIPSERIRYVPGRSPINRSIAADIYWNLKIGNFVASHYPQSAFYSPMEFCSVRAPKNTYVTLHDTIYRLFPELERGRTRRFWNRAVEWFARRQKMVLTVSKYSARDLVKYAGLAEKKLRVIYNFVGDEFFQPVSQDKVEALRSKYQLPAEFLLYLGGYNTNKNVVALIRAYAIAKRSAPTLPPLVLAGGVPRGSFLSAVSDIDVELERAGLCPGEVLLPGVIDEKDLSGLFAATSLFIFPSLYEGFGFTPVEALAQGTPTLVSFATSLGEIIPFPERHFDPCDVNELSRKIVGYASVAPPSTDEREWISQFSVRNQLPMLLQTVGVFRNSEH